LPFDIRNSKFIKIGKGFTTGKGCRLEAFPIEGDNHVLFIGENVQINDYVHITAMKNVSIGNNVLIASKVYISDSSHGSYSGNEDDSSPYVVPQERKYNTKKVLINDNVWLGEMVTILPGVTIGSGTIVGANSVVSKDLPSNVIAVGVPAKAIKRFNDESMKWERIKN
jgi:acetyltransferase-like isoleucine patch superfamily enzyme